MLRAIEERLDFCFSSAPCPSVVVLADDDADPDGVAKGGVAGGGTGVFASPSR